MKVVIVGARERASLKARLDYNRDNRITGADVKAVFHKDSALLDSIVAGLQAKYRSSFSIITMGCDDGVGAMVKATALNNHIKCVENSCHFYNDRDNLHTRQDYVQYYVARHAYLDEIGDEYHILVEDSRCSLIEDLVTRIKLVKPPQRPTVRTYRLYDEAGTIVEQN